MNAGIARCQVVIDRSDLLTMARFVKATDGLRHLDGYRHYLEGQGLPPAARFDPGHAAAMMGYDFHLGDCGPRLIEVNNNAGGVFLALQAQYGQDDIAAAPVYARARYKLLAMFAEEYHAYSGDPQARPGLIAIVDEDPRAQFNYTEMQVFAAILSSEWGVDCVVADPAELDHEDGRLFHQGRPVDLIYNRHCDFYLETDAMQGIADAYRRGNVCLTPNPWVYGQIGDKRRMQAWSDPALLSDFGLSPSTAELIAAVVPATRAMAGIDPDELWAQRKQWVFKPSTQYGSRGVLPGTAMRRKRFQQLDLATTIVQEFVPPTRTECSGTDGEQLTLKTDIRLFAYRSRILGVAARVYAGQVTNFSQPGSGYARVAIR